MSSADTPNTAFAQPYMRGSFHQSAPPQNSMANLRPRSSHGGVSLHVSCHLTCVIDLEATDANCSIQHPTVVELHQQIGNLQAQLTGSEDALEHEKRRTQRIRAERDDLRREVGQMNQKIQQQAWTISELKQKITDQARDLHEQEIKLEKQTKTIKVQSDTISGKQKQHTGDRAPFMTPSHRTIQRNLTDDTPSASAAVARRSHINNLPPPPFSLGRSLQTASYGPPPQSQQTSASQALVPYGGSAPSQTQRETRSIQSGLVAQPSTASREIDYMGTFQYIFSLTESWARNYANIPNVTRDSNIPPPFRSMLVELAGSNMPLTLLTDVRTRHFVIATFINRCLVERVLSIEALQEFSSDANHKLGVAKVHLGNDSK